MLLKGLDPDINNDADEVDSFLNTSNRKKEGEDEEGDKTRGDDLETDSDDEIIDTSEQTSMDGEEAAEAMAEAYAEQRYNAKFHDDVINYDHYQFSVA